MGDEFLLLQPTRSTEYLELGAKVGKPAAARVTLPREGFGWAPGESHALPGSSLVAGRALPSQGKELGSLVLSATSASPSALTGLLAQCPQEEL